MDFLTKGNAFGIIFCKTHYGNNFVFILFFRVAKLLDRRIEVGNRNKAQLIAKLQGASKGNSVNDSSPISEFLRNKSRSTFLVNLLFKRRYINFILMVVGCILRFSAAEGLGEQHFLSNKLLSTSRCGAFHIGPFKRIVEIFFIGNKQFNRVAGVLGNCLQQKNRLQNSFLVRIKSLISGTVIVVENGANIMSQIFLAFVIEEFPKHINRE